MPVLQYIDDYLSNTQEADQLALHEVCIYLITMDQLYFRPLGVSFASRCYDRGPSRLARPLAHFALS